MQGGGTLGGRHIIEFTVFKRKSVRLGSKMDHISVKLAFGRREKYILGYKKLQGRQKAYNKNRKKNGDLFFETVKFCGGGKKKQQGRQMVTLRHCRKLIISGHTI